MNRLSLRSNQPVEVVGDDCRKIMNQFREISRLYSNLRKENQRVSACNQPVGLANTSISTGYYAPKKSSPMPWEELFVIGFSCGNLEAFALHSMAH